jgi:hypothetical protein
VDFIQPGSIDVKSLKPETPVENARKAVEVAEKNLGIPHILV